MPAALNPLIGFLILLSHNLLNFWASEIFFVYLKGNGEIILFFKKALTILSAYLFKFLLGTKKKYRKIKIENLKTQISNKKLNQIVNGNTNTVYKNPLNSLRFVLNKIKKDKINLNKDFWVFTGSSVGVVPIKGKGFYTGKIDKLGSVKTKIR